MDPRRVDWEHKLAAAAELGTPCNLCARDCNALRGRYQNAPGTRAWCRAPEVPYIANEMIHVGEEYDLVPSHTVFFAGCMARCAFCHVWNFSQNPQVGVQVESAELAKLIDVRNKEGARNVNFVGGDATLYVPYVLDTLRKLQYPQQVVWNTAMYHREATARLLEGVVDVYLGDWKFGNDTCAREIAAFVDYTAVLRTSYTLAAASGARMIIRHLVMPGHVECCTKAVLDEIRTVAPLADLSLMMHYLPSNAVTGELARMANTQELDRAEELADASGLRRARTQALGV